MGEENHKHIPVLNDVVELGGGIDPETAEENIHIVADNALEDAFDDPYDDEFKKLFDHATDSDDDIDPAQLSIDDLDNSVDDAPPQDVVIAEAATGLENDGQPDMPGIAATDEVFLNADGVSENLANTEAESELWLSDWQEETATNAIFEQQDKAAGDELDILHTKAEIEITDEETAALIAAAVEEDDTPPDVTDIAKDDAIAPVEAVVQTQPAPANAPPVTNINTGELVNQIVTELLPEIEWKLRTKVREVLEQHFPPEDE